MPMQYATIYYFPHNTIISAQAHTAAKQLSSDPVTNASHFSHSEDKERAGLNPFHFKYFCVL